MQKFQLRIHTFQSGAVGVYAEKSGPEIIRIHRLSVQHATGTSNFNKIYTLYPEHGSTLLEVFTPSSASTEIKANAIYEEIDHFVETTTEYSAPDFSSSPSIPQTEDEIAS